MHELTRPSVTVGTVYPIACKWDRCLICINSFRGFFFGCVRNITYGLNETTLMPVNDIPSLRSYVTQGSCNLSLCDKRRRNKPPGICENQGVCVPSGASPPTCDCRWTGYNGTTCTEGKVQGFYICPKTRPKRLRFANIQLASHRLLESCNPRWRG
jgi:hypothetical protein